MGLNSAVLTAEQVREGTLSARDAVAASLGRIAQLDGRFNAFTVVRTAEALEEAAALDAGGPGSLGPLAGVPVAVKEEYDVAGCVTTLGGRGNSSPAANDNAVVRRLRAAGAVIVGKTNMPEFGQFAITESDLHGITRNPWDPTRSPGGSSGGSAVAVGTGMVPVGMSADGGGSIRIPASACGVIGLKPTRGRVSSAPLAEHWHGLAGFGPITRTVRDAAVVMDVICGAEPVDRWRLGPPHRSFVDAVAEDPARLRILGAINAVTPGTRVDPEIRGVATAFLDRLALLGHDVLTGRVRWPSPVASFLPLYFSGMRIEAAEVEHPALLERSTRTTAALAGWATPTVVARAQAYGRHVSAALQRLFDRVDVIALPTLTDMPPAADAFSRLGWLRRLMASSPIIGNTAIFNVSGHPAVSVPAGMSAGGLPIGMQLVARLGCEDLLLALAAQLERQRPWPVWEG